MKILGKRNVLVICAIVLTLLVSTGVSLAYFSDYEEAKGEVALGLSGQTEIYEDATDKQKVIRIDRSEGSTADVIVRVAIYGPDDMMKVDLGDGWKENKGYYYYNKILTADNPSTSEITASIEAYIEGLKEGETIPLELLDMDIIVTQESAIAAYDKDGKLIIPNHWELPAGFEITE